MKTSLFIIFLLILSFLLQMQAWAAVKIESPADGQTVGGIVPVVVTYSGSIQCPINSLYSYVLGYFYISPPEVSGTHTFYWDTSGVVNGAVVQLGVIASSGYSGVPNFYDAISVTVNNPYPVLTFVTPVDGAFIPPNQTSLPVTISFHSVAPNFHGINYASLQLSGNGIYPITRYFYLPSPLTSGTLSADFSISSYPLGEYTLSGYCTDDSGKGTPVKINITKGYPPAPQIDPMKQNPNPTVVGEPINVANGTMFTSQNDISIPAKELPLELTRNYNSQDNFNGQFGYGWRSNFDDTLKEYPDGSVVEVDQTAVYTVYSKNADGTYQPSPGEYSTLTKNADSTYTILRKHGQQDYFDTYGRLTKIEGRNSNAINILRDANGIITEVDDASGRKLLFTNDSNGRTTQITDPANRIFKYDYDANGNLTKVTDPLNNVTTYQYNGNNQLILKTDVNSHTLNFEYDSLGRAYQSWQDNNNNAVSLSFDSANPITTVTDSRGNITKYEYNTYGLVTKITDAQNNIQLNVWDGNMNKISVTDKNSNTTNYTYDSRGNLLTATDPLGNTTAFTYTSDFDFVKTITDAQGNLTAYDYDANGNLVKLTDALGNFTANVYDASGQLISTTNPRNYTTSFTYDAYGDLLTSTDALNNTITFSYDLLGNRTQLKDAANNVTQFTYNNLNQLTLITYPDSSTASFTYDALGNKLSATDNAGNTTSYTYDLNNHVTSITNPLGKTINFGYDTEGNRISVVDQNQHTTTYQYDSLNRLVLETNPLGLAKSYAYDPVGNRTSITDANSNTITYVYDSLNRLKKMNYPDATSVSFSYDSLGRRTSMTDSQGTTSYTYDSLGRLTQISSPGANSTLQYTYDSLGNRTSLTLPGGKTIQYSYDALGRISSITDSNNKTTTYTYDPLGNPAAIVYPNNVQATYAFDSLHRLKHLTNQKTTGSLDKLSDFDYVYDNAGRKSRVTLPDSVIDYTYDAVGELTQENNSSSANPYQATYEYDPSGNRTSMVRQGTEHLYTYNSGNQLTQENITGPATVPITVTGTATDASGIQSVTVNGSNAALNGNNFSCSINLSNGLNIITVTATDVPGNTSTQTLHVTYNQADQILYLYDNNGNLIKKQSSTQELNLSYDYENRLTQGLSPTGTVPDFHYGYDGEGKRISSTNGSSTTNYLYDGMDVVLERNGSGDPVASYLRNPYAAGGIGGIINSQQSSNPENYYSYDGLGSVSNLSDTTGANIQSYAYDAFGNLLTQANLANAHQFLTKEAEQSGLIYFGARYYDPTIGRFITQDPSGMADGPNMYMHVGNNPINLVDLWGLCSKNATAPFEWWDLTSWAYPGTNYCGLTKSGPGCPTSPSDSACKTHDECLSNTGVNWWQVWDKEVWKCHMELIHSPQDPMIEKKGNPEKSIRSYSP